MSKLRPNVVDELRVVDAITEVERQAAEEILVVWRAIGRGLFPRPSLPHGHGRQALVRGARRDRYRDPVDRMKPSEVAIWRRHYRPWAGEMAVVVSLPRVTMLQLVVDVVVDNMEPRDLDVDYRLPRGVVLAFLRAALRRYAEIAGWIVAEKDRAADLNHAV